MAHYTEFPPELAHRVRVAAALADMTPSRYVRTLVERKLAELAEVTPVLRADRVTVSK